MGRKLLHLLNGLITCAVVVMLAIGGAYAAYSLWDNQQVYNAAENVNSELREIRATMSTPTLSTMEQMLEENRLTREAKAVETAAISEPVTTAVPAQVTPAVTTETEPTTAVQASVKEQPAASATPSATENAAAVQTAATAAQAATQAPVPVEVVTNAPASVQVVTNAPATTVSPDTEVAVATEIPAATDAPVITNAPVVTDVPAATPAPEVSVAAAIPAVTAAPVVTSAPTATPAPTEEPDNSPFGQLKAINQDITAWLTMPGTAIDYPVLQGNSNYSYINTDVYGNFALAGSIFLDSRNSEDYSDTYSLLYGHNMSQHRMFSDVNLYKEKAFFNQYTLGMLLMPDGCHILESLSIIVAPASDSGLFNPENWTHLDGEGIYRMVQENALYTCEKGLEALREQIDAGETPRLVALSTCSDEFTDARTILLTLMDP